jgi:hypothetical protein
MEIFLFLKISMLSMQRNEKSRVRLQPSKQISTSGQGTSEEKFLSKDYPCPVKQNIRKVYLEKFLRFAFFWGPLIRTMRNFVFLL